MKNRIKAARAAIIGGTAALVSCFALTGCGDKNVKFFPVDEEYTQEFDVGEHILSVPIKDKEVDYHNVQYDYICGYEPVGISLNKNSKGKCEGAILYSNTDEVECKSNWVDKNGHYLFLSFGTPKNDYLEVNDTNSYIKRFDVGQHIISVSLNYDNRKYMTQYESHDGYEVIGISVTSYYGEFKGGAVLYKNIVPVDCVRDNNGYTTFGEPLEKEVTLNRSIN